MDATDSKKYKILTASNWDELASSLNKNLRCVIFNIGIIKDTNISDFLGMLESFISFNSKGQRPKIAVIINKDTSHSTVKELQKEKVLGIIPSEESYGISEYTDAFNAITNLQPYWPKHIINRLDGANARESKEVQLTPRQLQVFNLIAQRGLSNKQIAKTLKISESTVKIHVSAILKNLCVRNRTQLALTKL